MRKKKKKNYHPTNVQKSVLYSSLESNRYDTIFARLVINRVLIVAIILPHLREIEREKSAINLLPYHQKNILYPYIKFDYVTLILRERWKLQSAPSLLIEESVIDSRLVSFFSPSLKICFAGEHEGVREIDTASLI